MSRMQRKALKLRVRQNVKIRKTELRKLAGIASRFHFKSDRLFKVAYSNLRKEIRFYTRLAKHI